MISENKLLTETDNPNVCYSNNSAIKRRPSINTD